MKMSSMAKAKKISKSVLSVLLVIVMVLLSVPQFTQAANKKPSRSTSVTVSTQAEFTKALANRSIKTITIKKSNAAKFTVPKKEYKTKVLVINSSKATIFNNGIFQSLIITDADTLCENAKGNSITINDRKLTFTVSKNADVKNVTATAQNSECNITANGDIHKIVLSRYAKIAIAGGSSHRIEMQVKAAAKGSSITSSVPVNITSETNANITLKKGAEGSHITSAAKDADIRVENKTKKSIEITTRNGKKSIGSGTTESSKSIPRPAKKPANSQNSSKKPIGLPADSSKNPAGNPENPGKKPADNPAELKKPATPTAGSDDSPTNYPTNSPAYYTVSFNSDGGSVIDPVLVAGGHSIASLPKPKKDNYIFLGWYTDQEHQKEFKEDSAIYSNLILYAKYTEITVKPQNLIDYYTLAEQKPGLSFTIISSDKTMTAESVKSGLTLDITDGSKAVGLTVTGSNGTFQTVAQNGFTEGASFTLALSDSKLSFEGKESTVRKCCFTIAKGEVCNVELNKDIIYIPQSNLSDITKNGTKVDSLSVAVVNLNDAGNKSVTGTFTCHSSTALKAGDILCIYSGTKPELSPAGDHYNDSQDGSAAYIKVTAVTGSAGSQNVTYSDTDVKDVIFLPDVLPIAIGEGNKLVDYKPASENTKGSFTEAAADLNFSDYGALGLSGETTLDKGDYLAFYKGDFNNISSVTSIVYGKVNGITEQDGKVTVTFSASTEKEMQEALDYHSKSNVNSNVLLKNVNIAALEKKVEQQVKESGFAEKSSVYLTQLVLKTDGLKKFDDTNFDLKSYTVKAADGSKADLSKIKGLAPFSPKASIGNMKVNAVIEKGLQKLGGDGVRCMVAVSFDVKLTAKNGDTILISLSAEFIEELKIGINASGQADIRKWVFLPYLYDYRMDASVDVYDYTGINFYATVTTKNGTMDISKQLQKLLNSTDSKQVTQDVRNLYDTYQNMMTNTADWIDIFDANIATIDLFVFGKTLEVKTTLDFVVGGQINVALGCSYEYKSGTRYSFWVEVLHRNAGSGTSTLITEENSFQLYVLGKLGLRAGLRLQIAVGVFSVNLDSMSIVANAGVYYRIGGFFYYQYQPTGSAFAGSFYMDMGGYLSIAYKAQLLNGKYQYNPPVFDKEYKMFGCDTGVSSYDFSYSDLPGNINLKHVRTYTLPDSFFSMIDMDFKDGDIFTRTHKASDFNFTFTNSNFSFDVDKIRINNPAGEVKQECDMTITMKNFYMYFPNSGAIYPTRTFHLYWDDINEDGYTISFNPMGGWYVKPITQQYKTAVTGPTATRDGYTFNGWYSDENLTNKYTFSTMPARNIQLYAKWIPNTNTPYMVRYYVQYFNNANYFESISDDYLTGTTDTTVSAPEKTLDGFTLDKTISGTISSASLRGDGMLILKLYYVRNSYTLTFKLNNGQDDIVKKVQYQQLFDAPVVTKKYSYFLGWNQVVTETMPPYKQLVHESIMAAHDLTYTASWQIYLRFTIDFQTYGGSEVGKIIQEYGTPVKEPTPPTKAGYTFAGWYRDPSCTVPYTFSIMPEETFTLFAKWNVNTDTPYKVEHYRQNVSGTEYTLYETENHTGTTLKSVDAIPFEKIYTGFTRNTNNFSQYAVGAIKPDGSLILKLFYDRNTYSISFNTGGGSSVAAITRKYGAVVSAPENPVRTGYIFGGWYSDENLTAPYTFGTILDKNITLYAKWTAKKDIPYKAENYQQNLSDGGYTLIETENFTGVFGANVTASAKIYEGFTQNSSVKGTVKSGTVAADGSLILKLYYDRNTCSISFNSNGGDNVAAIVQKYGTGVSAPIVPVRSGYTFVGWYSDIALTNAYTFSTMPAGNITLYAKYLCNISFNSNGGSTIAAIVLKSGTAVSAPENPTRLDYTFDGWYSDKALTIPYTFSTMPAESITLYAKWIMHTDIEYKVEQYTQNEGGYVLRMTDYFTGKVNTTVTATPLTPFGYTYNSSAPGSVSSGVLTAGGNLILRLYYDRNTCTISFDSNGGSSVPKITQQYGTSVNPPDIPTKLGFNFAGWCIDKGLTGDYTFSTMPMDSITLYAKWNQGVIAKYKMEYYQQNASDDGYTLAYTENMDGTVDTTVNVAVKTYEGFTLSNNATGTVTSGAVKADGSLALKLYYDRNLYTISFIDVGGSPVKAITQKYGSAVPAPENPTREGATFDGWYTDISLTNAYTFSTMQAKNITLHAKWKWNESVTP